MTPKTLCQVPNLYDAADLGAIIETIRPRAKRAKRDESRMDILSFFVDESSKNLRIALVRFSRWSISSSQSAYRGQPNELFPLAVAQCHETLLIANWTVQAFSPIGDAFRDRLRKFPSLVNCCTIDWFSAWPTEVRIVLLSRKQVSSHLDKCQMFTDLMHCRR
jgi:dynein heavy chain